MVMGIEQYIITRLQYLVNNYNNDDVCMQLYRDLVSNYNINVDENKALDYINKAIIDYKNNNSIETIANNLIVDLKKIAITKSVPSSNSNPKSTPKTDSEKTPQTINTRETDAVPKKTVVSTPTSNKRNINVETDVIEKTLSDYKVIQETIEDNNIKSEGYVSQVFNEYQGQIKNKEDEINQIIQTIGVEVVNDLEQIDVIDNESAKTIMRDDISFSELVNVYSMYKTSGTKIKLADEDFFAKSGYKVNNGIVSITDSKGINYKYDVNTNVLIDSNGHDLTVRYYVPSSYSDLSSLNTITCLSGQREGSIYEMTGMNSFYLDDISTNAILVMPKKKTVKNVDIKKASFAYMSEDIASGTNFAKVFSRQQNAKNIMVGCSNGGASGIKIVAQSGDTYDTAIGINTSVVFQGDGKGINPGDDARLTEVEARNLNNKNLVFINTSGDGNLENGSNSYAYRGITRILDYCPNADVTMITNNKSNIYSNISNRNYHYYGGDSNFWNDNFGSYSAHGEYHKIFKDIINSGILN